MNVGEKLEYTPDFSPKSETKSWDLFVFLFVLNINVNTLNISF